MNKERQIEELTKMQMCEEPQNFEELLLETYKFENKMLTLKVEYLEEALRNSLKINEFGEKELVQTGKRTAKNIADWIGFRAKNSGYGEPIIKVLEEISEKIRENYHANM